jgi:hypothetical protein
VIEVLGGEVGNERLGPSYRAGQRTPWGGRTVSRWFGAVECPARNDLVQFRSRDP